MEMARYSFLRRNVGASAIAIALVTAACASRSIPPPSTGAVGAAASVRSTDTTSILKKLTKDVTIGSTVDSKNGDKAPRAITIVPHTSHELVAGQLLVCNFDDSAGDSGHGTTVEILNPQPKSKPTRFAQSASIEGCDGNALDSDAFVFVGGLTSGKLVEYDGNGVATKTYAGSPIKAPFADALAPPQQEFGPEEVFVGTTIGGIVNIGAGFYGNGKALQVAKGFAVSNGSQGELAPSGLQYDKSVDTLYIADGVTNTVVEFTHASELAAQNEITVQPGGKTFKCEFPKVTCGKLVKAGTPLNAPLASALLPNGNLIVANTAGTANELVELTPTGQILATKVVDSSKTQGVFGLAAAGSNDGNTVLFFTDTNSNTLQELEQ
jgi:hypothetical protein